MIKRSRKEKLGNRSSGVSHYVLAFIINAIIHVYLFFAYNFWYYDTGHFVVSYIFFTYPVCFVLDIVWSMRPSVVKLLNGTKLVNRKYYMNKVRDNVDKDKFYDVTISIPVYLEDNKVVFNTVTDSVKAAKRYRSVSGKKVNIIVSDDGIGAVLKENCTKEKINELIVKYHKTPRSVSKEVAMVLDRIVFYRKNNVAFVARPKENRPGLFKKGSNLNYTLRLGDEIENGRSIEDLTSQGGKFERGYAEGDVITNEIIMLLDKDSGVSTNIIEAIMPEFVVNEELAYVQCVTNAADLNDSFFVRTMGVHVNNLFHNIWPCNALKGFFVPLVGHNAFMRKQPLKEIGYWDETKVSEDYDAALKLYSHGYHGKYAHIHGLEFTEYASRTYTEEAAKQYRYTYGLFEMMFEGSINFKRARKRDIFYMIIYFLSKIYIVITIPYVLFVTFFGDINIMWAGFMLSQLAFMMAPFIRRVILGRKINKKYLFSLPRAVVLAFSYLGYCYSAFMAAIQFFINKFKKGKTLPTSSVDTIKYCFSEGVVLMNDYIANNMSFLIIAILCIDRIISVTTRHYSLILTKLTIVYILLGVIIMPFLLTPHFYHITFRNRGALKKINPLPLISLIIIMIGIPIISYNYYKDLDYGSKFLNNTNSMSLLNPVNDFSYKFLDIEPGQTKEINFEVTNGDSNGVIKNNMNYSIYLSKNRLPFKYNLVCNSGEGNCLSIDNMKNNKYYSGGVMPSKGDIRHNYTLYVTWEAKDAGNDFVNKVLNYVDLVNYNLLPNKRVNIEVLANNYIYKVSSVENKHYVRKTDDRIKFTVDAKKSLFEESKVKVDGSKLSKNFYEIKDNTVILQRDFLNTLDTGKHKFEIVLSNNGKAKSKFYIEEKTRSKK